MEFYQKPESHQTQNSNSEQKTLDPTIEGKRPGKQSITSKSNGNNCPEIDIKQEIPSFDDDYVSKSRTSYDMDETLSIFAFIEMHRMYGQGQSE